LSDRDGGAAHLDVGDLALWLVLDVLLERIELATIDQLSSLPGAGDLEGPSPATAASDVINRHNTVRSVLVAQAWGECQP
jgi:hypothetical protein